MRAILTYHSIDPSGSVISISDEVFRRHVKWLARGGVKVVSVPDLVRLGDDVDAVALTFDDGFANFGEAAAGLLTDAGFTATIFVVTDFVGGTNSWEFRSGASVPLLPLMDWHQLARLQGAGLQDEIRGSGERLASELGTHPEGFAYPFGETSPAAVRGASGVFAFACTTEFRLLSGTEDAHRLPRLDMYYFREPRRLESFGTAAFARYVAVRGRARRLRNSVSRALRKTDE